MTELVYDSAKPFDKQSEDFKSYVKGLYLSIPKVPYPEFTDKGSIIYNFEDDKLHYAVERVQKKPFSTSDRSVANTIFTIKEK